MQSSFLRNIELWLSAAGIAIILLVPRLIGAQNDAYWQVAVWTAASIGVLHGLIIWGVRQRQRQVRHAAVSDIRNMLKDRINNRLSCITLNVSMIATAEETLEDVRDIEESVKTISALLDAISEESVQDWKATYAVVLDRPQRV
ncbi:MAG: hypothetical protein H7Z42_08505 [Roseiflexaceae bacterium]|nr:hypothetical protein [Roseiflexaceae bacterium]